MVSVWSRRIAVATAAFAVAMLVAPTASAAIPDMSDGATTIALQTNQHRNAHGETALISSGAMNSVAQQWAVQLSKSGVLSHNPNYSSQIPSGWWTAGENVAYNCGNSSPADRLVTQWKNSSGHNFNMLKADYTHIGVGYYADGSGCVWGVQVFGGYRAGSGPAGGAVTAASQAPAVPNPELKGQARVGSWVKADLSAWASTEGVTYQWRRDGEYISGATSRAYKLTPHDVGHSISVRVQAGAALDGAVRYSSSATVRPGFITLADIGLKGTPVSGEKLELSYAGLQPSNGTLSVVWKRDGNVIPAERALSYEVTAADEQAKISATVTIKQDGYYEKKVEATLDSFDKVRAPKLAGTARVDSWVKADVSGWSDSPAFTYEWRRDGKVIPGATSRAYKVQRADLGHQLKVKVVATKEGFTSVTKYSAATGDVRKGILSYNAAWMSGKGKVGTQLTAKYNGLEQSGVKTTITWRRDGKTIPGATGATYRLQAADAGSKITARIQFNKPGYYTKVAWTNAKISG